VIVPTSIYAPGTLTDGPPDAEEAATGAPPHAGPTPGPGAGQAPGYPVPPGYPPPPAQGPPPAAGHAFAPGYGPPPVPGYAQNADYADPGYGPAAYGPGNPPGPGPGQQPYGETVNGGAYAYVIREHEAPAPGPSGPRAAEPGASPGTRPAGSQEPLRPGPPAFVDPSMTAAGDSPAEPAIAYGPDDPGYGPPSAEWYASDAEAERRAAEEFQPARGAFEPPQNQGESGPESAVGLEPPGAGEDDQPGGATPLEQIRDFYLTAEAISAENLDRHFGELLERQRQLISEYFTTAALQENPR
jgi:hypothetical protein